MSEAVWTEACAKLNELSFGLNRVDLDGYKVGGYIDVCTAILEDTDFNLADYLLNGIAQAIGLAVDKAILYGTDVKMPLGIVTRLAQATKPSDYSAVAPEWVDLSTRTFCKQPKAQPEQISTVKSWALPQRQKESLRPMEPSSGR